jgi:hypothetical protein
VATRQVGISKGMVLAHEIINGLYEQVIRDGVAAGGLRVEARCHESLRALVGAGR